MFSHKNKIPLFLVLAAACLIMLTNSCKKEKRGTLSSIITGGYWQLASVIRTTTQNALQNTDTLNKGCNIIQRFTFNSNGTCTYTNFGCDSTKAVISGHWSISADQHYLLTDLALTDTTISKKPFDEAEIYNLGQYSLVLRTGDLARFYPSNAKVVVTRYGFVRQKKL